MAHKCGFKQEAMTHIRKNRWKHVWHTVPLNSKGTLLHTDSFKNTHWCLWDHLIVLASTNQQSRPSNHPSALTEIQSTPKEEPQNQMHKRKVTSTGSSTFYISEHLFMSSGSLLCCKHNLLYPGVIAADCYVAPSSGKTECNVLTWKFTADVIWCCIKKSEMNCQQIIKNKKVTESETQLKTSWVWTFLSSDRLCGSLHL